MQYIQVVRSGRKHLISHLHLKRIHCQNLKEKEKQILVFIRSAICNSDSVLVYCPCECIILLLLSRLEEKKESANNVMREGKVVKRKHSSNHPTGARRRRRRRRQHYDSIEIIMFLIITTFTWSLLCVTYVETFSFTTNNLSSSTSSMTKNSYGYYHYHEYRIRDPIRQRQNPLHSKSALFAKQQQQRQPRRLLEILNDEVSELILDKLNQKFNNGHSNSLSKSQTHKNKKKKSRFQSPATDGLSKFHRNILASTMTRQRCVTGQYPLRITVKENPTRKWLSSASGKSTSTSTAAASTSEMLVNGTSIEKSLASYDRFQWLDDEERTILHQENALMSLELVAEIHLKKPGYVNILPASAAGSSAAGEQQNKYSEVGAWKNRYKYPTVTSDENRNSMTTTGKSNNLSRRNRGEMEKERMWITGFSLTKQSGELHYVDIASGQMGCVNEQTAKSIRWPNEVNSVPTQYVDSIGSHHDTDSHDTSQLQDALLVSDGFLVPGRDNGGLYVVSRPGHESNEWKVCLTGGHGVDRLVNKLENKKRSADSDAPDDDGSVVGDDDGWFYHRSVWIDLTGDGRQSILTARAKRPSILKKSDGKKSSDGDNDVDSNRNSYSMPTKAQLVWLERPKPFSYDVATGTPLDKDGLVFDPFGPKHAPWKVRVLDEGPDVMFSIADLDTTDDTVEVFASQFFSRKLTLQSIRIGPIPKVVWRRVLDDRCGASFSSILANLDRNNNIPTRKVIDCGSTIPTLKPGDGFSHLLVTSHECTLAEDTKHGHGQQDEPVDDDNLGFASEIRMGRDKMPSNSNSNNSAKSTIDGGSLFSYRVPDGKDGWRSKPWLRSVIATGFRVKGQLGNMINPGAPGFCYTFYPTEDGPRTTSGALSRPLIAIAGDCAESAYILRPVDDETVEDPSANYAMMCEIECGATVGSIGVGYEDFCFTPQQSGYAKIYVPCFEKDKILVFALGDGNDDDSDYDSDDGW